MRVAIVENTRVTHHGQVGVALHEVGALVDIYRPWRDGILPASGSFDALVSFGGEQSALDDETHPYLPRLASLLAETAAKGTAALGICLGAQVMARGAGRHQSSGQGAGVWLVSGHKDRHPRPGSKRPAPKLPDLRMARRHLHLAVRSHPPRHLACRRHPMLPLWQGRLRDAVPF